MRSGTFKSDKTITINPRLEPLPSNSQAKALLLYFTFKSLSHNIHNL